MIRQRRASLVDQSSAVREETLNHRLGSAEVLHSGELAQVLALVQALLFEDLILVAAYLVESPEGRR